MEQVTINKPGQKFDDKAHQLPEGNPNKGTQANSLNQNPESDEEEIIEKRNITDYWALPNKDSKTFNQNIKMRNR